MRRKEHLKQGLQSWRPKKYRALIAKKYPELLTTTVIWLFFSVILMVIVAIPQFILFGNTMEEQLSSFDTFSIDTNISLREPITLSTTPLIVVHPEQENLSKEKVLINDMGIVVKRSFWRGTKIIPWSTILDVPAHASLYANWLRWGVLLLLPTIVLVVGIIFAVEAIILALLCTTFGFLVSKLFRFKIVFMQLLKVATLAIIPLMILQIIPFFYIRWWLVPIALYVLLVFAASWLVGESKLERQHH